MRSILLAVSILPFLTTGPASAQEPIVKITDAQPGLEIFQAASRTKPLAIESVDQAREHFSKTALASLQKQVDFQKQFVLVFAWRGSGQDRLTHSVAESYPEQIVFDYKPGRTRDLRQHVYVFALRKNVTWSVKKGVPW